ncbi:hypothetical protein CEXT_815711 [Caerostris extrusa]|uniref:Uncharacterized protein n=1 Tax=Caerostris extrusa TaxID=172846 RepID=A0AAV4TC09_CAEEX|nr:hypothetical protein CEXT_815711 [Caerostris extrusa]
MQILRGECPRDPVGGRIISGLCSIVIRLSQKQKSSNECSLRWIGGGEDADFKRECPRPSGREDHLRFRQHCYPAVAEAEKSSNECSLGWIGGGEDADFKRGMSPGPSGREDHLRFRQHCYPA